MCCSVTCCSVTCSPPAGQNVPLWLTLGRLPLQGDCGLADYEQPKQNTIPQPASTLRLWSGGMEKERV